MGAGLLGDVDPHRGAYRMVKLTEHFTLDEFTRSSTALRRGIINNPTPEIAQRLLITATGMEQIRALLGAPVIINSGYRSPELNAVIGGSSTSQHSKGEAADFVAPGFGSPREICLAILDSDIAFDQLIEEGNWAHISFTDNPRRSILTAHFSGGRVSYTNGIA